MHGLRIIFNLATFVTFSSSLRLECNSTLAHSNIHSNLWVDIPLLPHQSRFLNNHQSLEYTTLLGTKFLSD